MRLLEYMEYRNEGGWGWKAAYEDMVAARFNEKEKDWAYLAGWYGGLLDDLIERLSERQLESIIRCLEEEDEGS
jgi:folate-dependent phosphoribosylglycinamide formyltransferase PurN